MAKNGGRRYGRDCVTVTGSVDTILAVCSCFLFGVRVCLSLFVVGGAN